MDKANDMKKELLKQMENDYDGRFDTSANSAWKLIETHKGQLGRLKWIAAAGWLITLIYAVGMHNLKIYVLKHSLEGVLTRAEFWFFRFSDLALIVTIIIPVLLTYLVYAKSKTLTMLQICARLANIEEQLKKISMVRSEDSEI